MATRRFCQRINNLFDSMNATESSSEDPENYKVALTTTLTTTSSHLPLWDAMYKEMETWNFIWSQTLTFPQQWSMTIFAEAHLWRDLQLKGYDHLLTGFISSDCLENFNG